jgi:hypothetical protein
LNHRRLESAHSILWATYEKDVAQIAHELPAKAREFALADWHCNPEDHRCLHDSWIESIVVEEKSSGDPKQYRSVDILVFLLGAYHDRRLALKFRSVRQYSIDRFILDPTGNRQELVGHGDVMEDAIELSDSGYITYSLRLEFGSIRIEAKDIEFSEELI